MKNIKTFIIIVFSILNFSACNTPEPIDQDETMLWLANGRSYKEVLASVETRIDITLPLPCKAISCPCLAFSIL